MADQTLLAKARKARFDDLPNFSGHPTEDVERFLKSIKNITKANDDSHNHEILGIVCGKLTQSAGLWFDNNESIFKTWSDFETAFRNRYFSTTMTHKKFDKLKQRTQSYDGTVTSYCDYIVNLCREPDPDMSEQIIIQHLMSGLNPDFRKELLRRTSSITTLNEFLKYATVEQDLYDTFDKSRRLSLQSQLPYFGLYRSSIPSLTTIIQQSKPYDRNTNNMKYETHSSYPPKLQRSVSQRNSDLKFEDRTSTIPHQQVRNYPRYSTIQNRINNQSTFHQYNPCKRTGAIKTRNRSTDFFSISCPGTHIER